MSKPVRIARNLVAALAIIGAFAFAAQLLATERQRAYSYHHFELITPDNSAITVKGARWIQVTVAGNVTFLNRDGTASDAYPMQAYTAFELGWNHVGVKATGTTATGIFAFFDIDAPDGPLP